MRKWLRRLAIVLLLAVVVPAVAGLGLVGYYAMTLPDQVRAAADQPPSLTVLAADGTVIGRYGPVRGQPLAAADLPQHLVRAVMAIEDRRFLDHFGIDPLAVLRAAWVNLRAGHIVEGGSTITQQLARMTYLSPERTFRRKAQEMLIALWFERRLSKEEILARYLNSVYLGAGAVGVDAAARRYFGKGASELTLAEAAMIAGLIRAPSYYSPARDPQAARDRAAVVLDAMVEAGWLTAAAAAEAKASPIVLAEAPQPAGGPGVGYFADWAAGEAMRVLGPAAREATVETTLEPDLQALAERIVARALRRDGARSNASQAALVAMGHDGAVLAMVGGTDYEASQFNRATQALRQPGSLFKLFVYLAALEAGFTPDDWVEDRPISIGTWRPANHDGVYRGLVTLREAFAHSINSVAVQLAEAVGRERVAETARSLGIGTPLPPVPSLALGTAEVTLLDMTAAYAAVAADRARVQPWGIRAVKGGDRSFDTRPSPAGRPSWSRREMLDLLMETVRSGTAQAVNIGRPVAGKTGTSTEYRDAWFVGFTADAVVGVWVGNDDGAPMDRVSGGRLPAAIWRDFMIAADRLMARRAVGGGMETAAASGEDASSAVRVFRGGDAIRGAAPVRPPEAETAAAGGGGLLLAGVPEVLDTATIAIGGRTVRLVGVVGAGGEQAREMRRYIGGREVTCEPAGERRFRCEVGGYDLSEAVLYNGGGRSAPGAPDYLRAAETEARLAGRGIWSGR